MRVFSLSLVVEGCLSIDISAISARQAADRVAGSKLIFTLVDENGVPIGTSSGEMFEVKVEGHECTRPDDAIVSKQRRVGGP